MERLNRAVFNLIFFIQVLLIFLVLVEDRIDLPAWLQVAGRMHPLVLHIPIGAITFLVVLMLVKKQIGDGVLDRVVHVGLLLTALSAATAALFGFFLSLQSDYGADALMRHKAGGILLSWLCYGALLWHTTGRSKSVFLGLGIVSCLTLIFTGHTGAVLTHGDNFLLAPVSRPTIVLTADNASAYDFAIRPILERKCFTCHNETKAKGGLVMTTVEKFKTGGENGEAFVAGNPDESRMIHAFFLPLSDDAHMPPDGKPQLTDLEVEALKSWIKSGADFEKKLAQYEAGDSLRLHVASLGALQPETPVEVQYPFDGADDAVVEGLNTPFRNVFPLYQNSPALQADFFVRKQFEERSLADLSVVRNQLVVLNLSKMPVTDANLSIIGSFDNLEQLNLNFTSVQGPGLQSLGPLKSLISISLAGTAVQARDLAPLLALPKLRNLYLWSTNVSAPQIDSLSAIYPALLVMTSQFNDKATLRLSKPILENEGVIRKGEEIVLKHPMPGVTIRYTVDGTVPDTLTGLIYDKPLLLNQVTPMKAIACKGTWYCSAVLDVTCFVQGLSPVALELLTAPDPKYPGEGAVTLTDGRKGIPDVLKEPSWLGYRNQPFEVGVSFGGQSQPLSSVVLSYGKNLGAYCFPPREVQVWAGPKKDKLRMIRKVNPVQPEGYETLRVASVSIPIDSGDYAYYKIIAIPVERLPAWHSGKGDKGWVFVDEIFFY